MARIPEEAKLEILLNKDVEELKDDQVEGVLDYAKGIWNGLPVNAGPDLLGINCLAQACMKMMIEKGVATEEELNNLFRREYLTLLKALIEEAKKAMARQAILEGVHMKLPPGIIPNDGQVN